MVVGNGSTYYGKYGLISLSYGSGGAMSLKVGSSMINEGGSVRMLAVSRFVSDTAGGLIIVSGGSSEVGIIGNIEFLSIGPK